MCRWWSAGKNCTEDDDTRSVNDQTTAELDIANMVGVFIVLACFTCLAIAVDIGDRVYRRLHEVRCGPTVAFLVQPSQTQESRKSSMLCRLPASG